MLSNLALSKNSLAQSNRQWNKVMSQSSSLSRLQELLPQLFQSTQLPGDPYLRCQLVPEVSALLSMAYVQESLLVPGEKITPIPNMSPFVIGLMNSRDRVFCAIDLAQLLGLSSPYSYSRQYHIIVIRVSQFLDRQSASEQELLLGLVVNRVQGITRVMSDAMRSPQGNFPPSLTPYIRGCVVEKDQPLPVLDPGAIANAPHLS
jgi:positive phototaxis protein PixI